MPLYSAAVMTGGAVFAATQFGVDFEVALLIFALVTAAYVIPGGLKAVMYTDSFQGFVMILAMIYLLWFTYASPLVTSTPCHHRRQTGPSENWTHLCRWIGVKEPNGGVSDGPLYHRVTHDPNAAVAWAESARP
jgi:Na+/proline symporter